ncbi:MAG: presqualene diphosphate synthase HpnD [Deltaproteobacteria bacterium]|nr:presqualene diphosphate synthase HpnD [Deltaproteobacteria bacterium]
MSNRNLSPTSFEITQKSGSNFYLSLFFLSRKKRQALATLYAFARLIDDIVDEPGSRSEKEKQLQFWKDEIGRCYGGRPESKLGLELVQSIQKYQLSSVYFFELIDGISTDLYKNQYATFEELSRYCYGVAGTVGLLCMELFGLRHERARDYAITLGRAFQLTNILRDLAADVAQNRFYLPEEDLKQFGYTAEDLRNHRDGEAFQRLIHFEVERADDCFQKAARLLKRVEKKKVLASLVMTAVYYRILKELARSPSRIFGERISLSPLTKLTLAAKAWFQCQLA